MNHGDSQERARARVKNRARMVVDERIRMTKRERVKAHMAEYLLDARELLELGPRDGIDLLAENTVVILACKLADLHLSGRYDE